MHIDQLRSQESFSAHLFLSLAVKCALNKLLYKIYALTYVSTRTYTTQVRFHSSLAAIYRAQHDTSSALSPVQGTMCCCLRAQMACRCSSSRHVRAAGVRCARAAELCCVFELHHRPRSHTVNLKCPLLSIARTDGRAACNRAEPATVSI